MIKNCIETNRGITIGKDSKTCINLLLGFNEREAMKSEYEKIDFFSSEDRGIHIITDLSLCNVGRKERLWEKVLDNTSLLAGTVPVYLAVSDNGMIELEKLKSDIMEQCEKGVSIITIHPTVNRKLIALGEKRLMKCTSRGGGIVIRDLLCNQREENAYLLILDDIIKACRKSNTVISLGSTFRSGTIGDAMDETYLEELKLQFELAEYIESNGVNVMLETPGHAAPKSIKKICNLLSKYPYPIMPLGPMPTDIAGDEDDTAAVIGAVLMGENNCADVLSVVTCEEHLGGIPSLEAIYKAVKKYRIAAHIIDISKLNNIEKDIEISRKRAENGNCNVGDGDLCLRCGKWCPLRKV